MYVLQRVYVCCRVCYSVCVCFSVCLCVLQGVFVSFVHTATPAALAGLRFGDQILQINGQTVAGWDTDKATKVLKDAPAQRISFAVRDR